MADSKLYFHPATLRVRSSANARYMRTLGFIEWDGEDFDLNLDEETGQRVANPTVEQLRDILSDQGKKTGGSKAELIARLSEQAPDLPKAPRHHGVTNPTPATPAPVVTPPADEAPTTQEGSARSRDSYPTATNPFPSTETSSNSAGDTE